ncbi:MAG: nuclear transport factor 2 family protein [Deltaproteobacteria bacterium]|nr:nuclear transport factor 2 family protein [Deltaproteobacteria bacterium]
MSSKGAILDLADRLFLALEAGDLDAVRALHAPHALVWHNNDRIEQSREENMASLAAFVGASRSRFYEVTRREPFHGGFFQQHVLRVESHAGETFEVPACVVCLIEDGRITRLDEYFDSAQIGELVEGLTRGLS